MPGCSLAGVIAGAALALLAAPAIGAPPLNDRPETAATFAPYTAPNGTPTALQAVAELFEATADSGVPRCLGSRSFARTVWYRIPEAPGPTRMTVQASGPTTAVVDLAAFVQHEVAPAPTPVPTPGPTVTPAPTPPPPRATAAQAALVTREPNACDGVGAGGSDAALDPVSAVTLLVPPRRPVLVQVGGRGAAPSADAERILVTLERDAVPDVGTPPGDRAGSATPRLPVSGSTSVPLGGATITDEDPAEPPCPSLGTVWRKLVPNATGRRVVSVSGADAMTLTVFAGGRPTGDNVLDCVDRGAPGPLEVNVPLRRGRPVWVRIGVDRAGVAAAKATVRLRDGSRATVVDGGPGGFDPTTGGPGGGLPAACDRADPAQARISGPRLRGGAGAGNRLADVPVAIRVRGALVCDAELRLYGPRGSIYAKGLAVRLKPGRRTVRLARLRTLRPGSYRLEVKGVSLTGQRFVVRGGVRGRLSR